jgi:tetratricopeptide (TPR) repeat protein
VRTLALPGLPLTATALIVALTAAPGCRTKPTTPPAPPAVSPPLDAAAADHELPFVENDYPRALTEARTRGVPLFVDAWAPWCHTCLSMRSYVFTDPAMQPLVRRFVWLSLDTEREDNAPVVTRLGIKVLPTLFVIDPATEAVRLAHPGSLTATELVSMLDAEGANGAAAPRTGPVATADAIDRLHDTKQNAECVTQGAAAAASMPPGTPRADVLRAAIECAGALPTSAPERAHLPELVATGERVVSAPSEPILADDRSDLYDYLVDALHGLGRDDEAKRLAGAWVAFLDAEAARATSPSARAVFDAHRLLAYTAVGEPGRAVPMLEASERDFPDDYNPPARLGKAYFDMKRYTEAIAALERALARAYGPRKLRFWSLEADAYLAQGDAAGARAALGRALDFAATTPLTGAYPQLRDAIAERRDALGAGPDR